MSRIMNRVYLSTLLFVCFLFFFQSSCVHEPVLPKMENPIDTMHVDTSSLPACDSNRLYFDLDILPILNNSCSIEGCHNTTSAAAGVILVNYDSIVNTTELSPFNLSETEIFSVLISDNPDERMPPESAGSLSAEEIQLIAQWILEGADDMKCNPYFNCNIMDVSFMNDIRPIIQSNCEGCHSGQSPGGGILLNNYENIRIVAADGSLFGSINWESNYVPMPQGSEKLSDCEIGKIKSWIEAGSLNN